MLRGSARMHIGDRPISRFFAAFVALVVLSAGLSVVVTAVSPPPASADTQPVDPTQPETVSAAALPTVQINGVVWAQVIVGNRVYATGEFTQAASRRRGGRCERDAA